MWCKIPYIKNKYTTTADYNTFTKDIVANKMQGAELVDKSYIVGFINNAELDKKSSNISNKRQN